MLLNVVNKHNSNSAFLKFRMQFFLIIFLTLYALWQSAFGQGIAIIGFGAQSVVFAAGVDNDWRFDFFCIINLYCNTGIV